MDAGEQPSTTPAATTTTAATTITKQNIGDANNNIAEVSHTSAASAAEDLAEQTYDMTLYELLRSDVLKCSVCGDVYIYPCLLPCLHSFCGRCIDELRKSDDSDKGLTVRCPTCHSCYEVPVGGFPCNHFLLNLAELFDLQQDEQRPCSYCQYEGSEVTAVGRCLECGDDLCSSCRAAHKKTKLTRTHRVAPFDQIQFGRYDLDLRQSQLINCNVHTTEACTSYCESCSQFRCDSCKTCTGHQLLDITQGEDNCYRVTTKDSVTLAKLLSKQLPIYDSRQQDLYGRCNQLTNCEEEITTKVMERAKLLHDLVDRHQETILKDLMEKTQGAKSSMDSELESVSFTSLGYKANMVFIKNLVKYGKDSEIADLRMPLKLRLQQITSQVPQQAVSGAIQDIRLEQTTPKDVCDRIIQSLLGCLISEDMPSPVNNEVISTLSNKEDTESSENVSTTCRTISQQHPAHTAVLTTKLLPKVETCLEFSASLPSDSNNCWPTGVCCIISTGELVICDRDNAVIKIFSANTGSLKHSFSGEASYRLIKPFDVASLSTGELVVSDYGDESVKVFSASGVGRLLIRGEFEYPRGVATTDQDLILVLDSELGRITIHSSKDGKLLKIVKGNNPASNLIDPYYICITRMGHILVTDFAEPNVKILSVKGEQLQLCGEYGVTQPQALLQPYGCHQDDLCLTFIADSRNDRISLMLPSGEFVKHLISRKDGLWQPIALCSDISGRLVVTEALGKVKIFKYV